MTLTYSVPVLVSSLQVTGALALEQQQSDQESDAWPGQGLMMHFTLPTKIRFLPQMQSLPRPPQSLPIPPQSLPTNSLRARSVL